VRARRQSRPQPAPHDSQVALRPGGCFLGRYEIKGRAQHLAQKLIRPVALALEIRPVTGGSGFDFGQPGFQHLDPGLQCLRDRGVTGWWPGGRRLVLDLGKVDDNKGFPVVCFLPWQPQALGERSGGLWGATQTLP
jgi:hypothetical protein